MRQKFPCTNKYCAINDNDPYTLNINLLDVTFNVPNATYCVVIDDGFLKYRSDDGFLKRNGINGVIPGVKRDNWVIKTTKGIADFVISFFID